MVFASQFDAEGVTVLFFSSIMVYPQDETMEDYNGSAIRKRDGMTEYIVCVGSVRGE